MISRSISFFLLCFFVPLAASAATLQFSLASKAAAIGQATTVRVIAASATEPMNAVSGTLLYPSTLSVAKIHTDGSIVDLWIREPSASSGRIDFEGVALSPGYQGANGTIFTVVFIAKRAGEAKLSFTNAAILANDGLGSNIITSAGSATLRIGGMSLPGGSWIADPSRPVALPVITEYSTMVAGNSPAYIKGIGEPGAVTKIVFRNTSFKSIGEQFIASLQTKRRTLDEVLVVNDPADGTFEYTTGGGIVAGAYSATPFLVDESTNTEQPGLGVQLFVSDSPLVRALIVVINVLALLIPVVGLGVLIYFIPWYSFRRMRVIRRRLGLEEGKLEHSRRALDRETAPPETL